MDNTLTCPYCGGPLIKKGVKRGKQCYKCKSCGKFNTNGVILSKPKFKDVNTTVFCPYCNSLNLSTRGKSNKGLIVYSCLDCNHRFTEETKERLATNDLGEICPRCSSTNIRRKGYNRIGHPRFYCTDCKRSYTKDAKLIKSEVRVRPELSIEDKRRILMYKLNLNLPYPEIAKHFNCSTYMARQIVRKFYQGNEKSR